MWRVATHGIHGVSLSELTSPAVWLLCDHVRASSLEARHRATLKDHHIELLTLTSVTS